MLGDHRFERTSLAQGGSIFRAQAVEMVLAFCFFPALDCEQFPCLRQFLRSIPKRVANRFEFQRELSALAAEGFNLRVRRRHFALQALGFAIGGGHAALRPGSS